VNQSFSIKGVVVLVMAIFLALWIGVGVVTNQTETVTQVIGAAFLIFCMFLGRRIWLLFVFFAALDFPIIRGINTTEIGQAAFVGFSVLLFAIRRLHIRPRFGELEFWMLLVSACIVQAYFRNPVGLNIFGAGAVGGRPYVVAGLAALTGWLLSILIVPPKEIKWAMTLTFVGKLIGAPLTDIRGKAGMASIGVELGDSRVPWLGVNAQLILRWVMSKMSPIQAIARPLFFILILIAIGASAASGYRNIIAGTGLILLCGVYYYQGITATLLAGFAAIVCIALLSLVNILAPLPGTMQRALSPFPGSWEERYVRDAEFSTEWRVQMWTEALTSDRWIKNKMLGDGLGMTREELARLEELSFGGKELNRNANGLTIQQENMMLTGSYHSGPVQSIRTVGYVGLVVILLAMFRLVVHFHRLIKKAKGTEWFQPVLFLAMPMLIYPIQFVFIYGDFKTAMALLFFSFGICRLMQYNLPLGQTVPPPVPQPLGSRARRPLHSLSAARR
jgi:hypothetical protein